MAHVSFSPNSKNTNLSTSKTRMNFDALIRDFNNGLVSTLDGRFSAHNVQVSNVKQDQTVTATLNCYGLTFTRSYTSKYVDTDSRYIYEEINSPFNTTTFVNYLKANGNNLDATITSGTANFSAPITFWTEFKTKDVSDFASATVVGGEVDKNIVVTRNVGTGIHIALYQVSATGSTKIYQAASNSNSIIIPAGTITNLSDTYRLYVNSGVLLESSGPIEIYSSGNQKIYTITGLTVSNPTLTNLNYVGDLWERPISFNWIATNQEGYEYELYSNNVKVKSGTGAKETTFTVPANTFTSTLNPLIRIRNYRVYAGIKYYSNWVERSLSLKDIEATISSLLIEGDYWEKSIKVSWQSTNQQQFKIEVFKSNLLVKTYTGTTATSYTIPAEALTEGEHTIRVTVAYANRYVNSTERTVTLKNIVPTVSDLALSGSNIDLALVFSWASTDQQKYEVEILKDVSHVTTFSGTTGTSVSIAHSTLTTGLHKFRVRVAYKDRWSDWKEYTANLTETLPSIGVLEPDGIITKRDESTRLWWTSQNQSKWKLVIDEVTTCTGTTEKEKVLVPGSLTTGRHSMVLTVWYVTSLGVEKGPVTKKAEWIVQGVPPTPTITSTDIFNTNRPITTWDTQDQQGYILEVLKDNEVIYSTDWQNGLIVEHKVNEYLENGTYTVRVKVMNQYSLESDWGTKQITVNGVEDTDITLTSMVIGTNVQLTWDNPSNKFVKFYIIRNDVVIAKTTDTTYIDYAAHRDCIYTIRGVTVSDVYKDSNRAYEQVEIDRSILATVDKPNDQLKAAFFTDTDRFNANLGLECKFVEVSGREYPIAVWGEHSSKAISLKLLQCDSLDRLIEMFNRRQVFCYRDQTEKAYFVIQTFPYDRDSVLTDYEGAISATVVDYKESVEYD